MKLLSRGSESRGKGRRVVLEALGRYKLRNSYESIYKNSLDIINRTTNTQVELFN